MTSIGHTVTGFAAAAAVLPRGMSRRRMMIGYGVFGLIANIPDARIPGWGHYKYYISHSIFVTGALVAVALPGLWLVGRWKGWRIPKRVLVGGVVAWYSHFLLDSMYSHGRSIRMCWPVSSVSLVLPVPWFSPLNYSDMFTNPRTLGVIGIELACYLPLLGVVLLVRRAMKPKV